ncbi:hypothetical protein CLU79DRAFT_724443 [Phycomyces nitens]|nr:hypothetical protein CLU79DRAFT_724443 [Phycomyces nitens]
MDLFIVYLCHLFTALAFLNTLHPSIHQSIHPSFYISHSYRKHKCLRGKRKADTMACLGPHLPPRPLAFQQQQQPTQRPTNFGWVSIYISSRPEKHRQCRINHQKHCVLTSMPTCLMELSKLI